MSAPATVPEATGGAGLDLVPGCLPNTDISSSGCGNSGPGNSGFGNDGTGNSGTGNHGIGNSGQDNFGVGNSGTGNTGTGNSGCGNTGLANSGFGNTGTALSGGSGSCEGTSVPPVVITVPGIELPPTEVSEVVPSSVATLPLTGSDTAMPLAVALGLLLSGGAAVALTGRRREETNAE